MQVLTKKVSDLTPTEYKQCHRLNLGQGMGGGWMQPTLEHYRKTGGEARAVMLKDDELLVGWGLLSPTKSHFKEGPYGITPYVKRRAKYSLMLYVRRSHRGKGYGRILLDEARRFDPRPKVWYSHHAEKLYASSKVTANKDTRKRFNEIKTRAEFSERLTR
jgi:GNAT superfamily N-acetyltransferase